MSGRFVATKIYDHNEGLTCAWRLWKNPGIGRFLHGYSIHIKMVFESLQIGEDDLVIDLNDLREIEDWLHAMFDHTVIITEDDPCLEKFKELEELGALRLRVVPGVGPERFAEMIWRFVDTWLKTSIAAGRVNIRTIEVRESPANSGLFLF